MSKLYYREEQKYTQWWVWMLVATGCAAAAIPFWYGLYIQLELGQPWGDKPMSDNQLVVTAIVMTLFMAGIILLFRLQKLEITITDEGIRYRFLPFIRKQRLISPSEIELWTVEKYSPLKSYGGYGIRASFGKRGFRRRSKSDKAYIVYGNLGLRLKLKNGTSLTMSTLRKDAMAHAMQKMMDVYSGKTVI